MTCFIHNMHCTTWHKTFSRILPILALQMGSCRSAAHMDKENGTPEVTVNRVSGRGVRDGKFEKSDVT